MTSTIFRSLIVEDYQVEYMAREAHASGKYYPVQVTVRAHDRREAIQLAFDKLHEIGYSTNHPIAINGEPISGEDIRDQHETGEDRGSQVQGDRDDSSTEYTESDS